MFVIEVRDNGVHEALNALAARASNMKPILQKIGEDIQERTKLRFSTSTGPDGQRWAPNARSTIEAFIAKRRGFGKRGINKKGQALAMRKKLLIANGDLSQFIRYQVLNNSAVEVGTNWMASKIKGGAAIHQFGGNAGKGRKVKIPARPFLPIRESGELYPTDRALILEDINRYLASK